MTVATVAGADYRVRVGGYGVGRGTFSLVITTANCGGGSFQTLRHGCGAATLGYTGNAAVGTVTTFSLSGVTATPVVLLGASLLNVPLCPGCVLGANPDVVVPGATLPLNIHRLSCGARTGPSLHQLNEPTRPRTDPAQPAQDRDSAASRSPSLQSACR